MAALTRSVGVCLLVNSIYHKSNIKQIMVS